MALTDAISAIHSCARRLHQEQELFLFPASVPDSLENKDWQDYWDYLKRSGGI
jgi:hypothetical protein